MGIRYPVIRDGYLRALFLRGFSLWFRWTRVTNGLTDQEGDTFRMQMGNVFSNKLTSIRSCYGSPLTTVNRFPRDIGRPRDPPLLFPQSTFPNSINLSPSWGEGGEGTARTNNLKQRSFYASLEYRVGRRLPSRRRWRWDMSIERGICSLNERWNFDYFFFDRLLISCGEARSWRILEGICLGIGFDLFKFFGILTIPHLPFRMISRCCKPRTKRISLVSNDPRKGISVA